jgi:predicted SAM-dependent methyltransferase
MIYKVFPAHVFWPFWGELQLAWLRFRTRGMGKRFEKSENLLVNLGAGDTGRSGWVNVDTVNHQGINCVYDCRKHLPFPDKSVKGVFCEHFLEHIDYTEEIPYFLTECHRVLQAGGVCRIIVPDAELYLRAYSEGGWAELSRIRQLDSEQRDITFKCKLNVKMELINVVFRQGHEHKFAYDFEALEFILLRFGFNQVIKQEFGRSIMEELCIDQPHRASESLYVDAVK